jgi:hypothetical protein
MHIPPYNIYYGSFVIITLTIGTGVGKIPPHYIKKYPWRSFAYVSAYKGQMGYYGLEISEKCN